MVGSDHDKKILISFYSYCLIYWEKEPFKFSTHAEPHDISNDNNNFKNDAIKWKNINSVVSKEEYDIKVKENEIVFSHFI